MPLSEEDVERITAWFRERGVRGACPACGHKELGLADIVGSPVLQRIGVSTSEMLPAVATVCGHCGHIMLFSARMIGLR